MKYTCKIIFGQQEVLNYLNDVPASDAEIEINHKEYSFNSKQELNAFLKGIDEAVGWTEYHVVEDEQFIISEKS